MLKRNDSAETDAPVGAEAVPRLPGLRRVVEWLQRAATFSSLQRRIIFFNLIGLALLVVGMNYLSSSKRNPVEVQAETLLARGSDLASEIAADAAGAGGPRLEVGRAAAMLGGLSDAAGIRVRLYGLERPALTRSIQASNGLGVAASPGSAADTHVPARLEALFDRIIPATGKKSDPPSRFDAAAPSSGPGEEVRLAAMGGAARGVRVNELGEIVVSIAVPIRVATEIAGVLQLSSAVGDLEWFLLDERRSMLEIFVLMAIVSVLLSILLANMIVSPIRQLAQAAARSQGPDTARPIGPDKPRIPDMTARTDEIGELSGALIRMTDALYARIDAIESFAADVAHEIKNPLTSLRSAVETMQYAKTPQQAQRLIEVIRNDVARMDRLVTDISNASRLDAELVRDRMEPFDLGQLLTMLGGITETEGQARRVRVETRLSERPLIARGLEGPIAQVITNLLNNALSFAPSDSTIAVTGTRTAGGVRVCVEDEGPGIAPENLDAIFGRFYSERPHSEGFGNHSGLGLSISKQIVEAHGGQIRAENIADPSNPESGRGARLVFDLPG